MSESETQHKGSFFPKIGDVVNQASTTNDKAGEEREEKVVQEIESLCMECHEQGVTRLMLTSIPFFREVILSSFRCEHCGATNNEIQPAGAIRPEGTVYTTKVLDRKDLNRQLVRSESCEVIIPELELTLPPTNRGQLTTIEGLIRDIYHDLNMDQPLRRVQDTQSYEKIQTLLEKIKPIIGNVDDLDDDGRSGEVKNPADLDFPLPPFTVKLDDPAGNSFIEFIGSMADPKWNLKTYQRTLNQNIALGLVAPDDARPAEEAVAVEMQEDEETDNNSKPITDDEIFTFVGTCSSCGKHIETHMKKVNIPYFKDILIMSTNCEHCGYRDNEVKSGAAISPQGKRIILKCEDREDLSRDILKSETGGLTIPEIDLVLTHGTLGGRFTTVEGILEQIYEELAEKVFAGDSTKENDRSKFNDFLTGLKKVKNAEIPYTIILDDPLANSYIQNLYAPDPDPNMTIEIYDRNFEQNEELGLNDIKVEGYEEDAEEGKDKDLKKEITSAQ